MKSLSEKIIVVMTLVGVSVLTYQVLESLYICMKDIVEYNDLELAKALWWWDFSLKLRILIFISYKHLKKLDN